MLAGLLFATEDAIDRPGVLAATLPFGGQTLIEYQARLMIAAGVSQVLVAVSRVTPELLGAAARIRKRGIAVDVVRSASEAAARIHPLARVIVFADGLVTTDAVLAPLVRGDGDLLLTSDREEGLERLDADALWAGIARVDAQRLADTAQLPRDYDFLSTLLRVAVAQGAARRSLAATDRSAGHGIERGAQGLARRGRGVFASLGAGRVRWAERWILGPVARQALPPLAARNTPPGALLATGAVISGAGLVAIWSGWLGVGLAANVAAAAALLIGQMLAWLRGDDMAVQASRYGLFAAAAAALLATGWTTDTLTGGRVGIVLALTIIVAALLVERLRPLTVVRRWWASPSAFPLLLLPFAAAGWATGGLAFLALYAVATLAGGIEGARAKA